MNWNKIMRFAYWSVSTAFFFAASAITIALLKPGPTETQVMRFMHGMMSAMENSLMGASMETSEATAFLMGFSSYLSVVAILIAVITGLLLKLRRKL